MRRIKLCGLSTEADIETANELLPDYIGFVFAQKSRRYVDAERALALKKLLRPDIQAVGVFVREEISVIKDLTERGIIDVVQLHGQESAEYVRKLTQEISCPVIQAFRVDSRQDVLLACRSEADYILLDAGEGGTGCAFDWTFLDAAWRPYFLAGGLNAENVADAIRSCDPYGVDVSSGIETDGRKDREKMRAFVEAVRKEEKP